MQRIFICFALFMLGVVIVKGQQPSEFQLKKRVEIMNKADSMIALYLDYVNLNDAATDRISEKKLEAFARLFDEDALVFEEIIPDRDKNEKIIVPFVWVKDKPIKAHIADIKKYFPKEEKGFSVKVKRKSVSYKDLDIGIVKLALEQEIINMNPNLEFNKHIDTVEVVFKYENATKKMLISATVNAGKNVPLITIVDTDKDGVPDKEDKCLTKYGKYSGCPFPLTADTDKDGVLDNADSCRTVAGQITLNGCAPPSPPVASIDTDKDGVPDKEDKCLTKYGKYNGCPFPLTADTDKDGVFDNADSCRTIAGKVELNGCAPPSPPVASIDTDKDGVPDKEDKCLTKYGKYSGCPFPLTADIDKDGVLDNADSCRTVAGEITLNGCAPPSPPCASSGDKDKDGVCDDIDKCPSRYGEYSGCPFPLLADSDGDGIRDNVDSCLKEKGIAGNNGCPPIVADADKDGVPDTEDECKDDAGDPKLKGCPDSDGDGVVNRKDECPGDKGDSKLKGCPCEKAKDIDGDGICDENDSDMDGDGITNFDDQCPDVRGTIKTKGICCGCPDSDGDGLCDKEDECPDKKGIDSLNGCQRFDYKSELIFNIAAQMPNMKMDLLATSQFKYDSLLKDRYKATNINAKNAGISPYISVNYGFFFGNNSHWGVSAGLGFQSMKQSITMDTLHLEYKGIESDGDTYRRILSAKNWEETISMSYLSLPLSMKYRGNFSKLKKGWSYFVEAGPVFNFLLSGKSINASAKMDYELVAAANGSKNIQFTSEDEGLLYTQSAIFSQAKTEAATQARFRYLLANGYDVMVDTVVTSEEAFKLKRSTGFAIRAGVRYDLPAKGDVPSKWAFMANLYYQQANIRATGKTDYQFADKVGEIHTLMNGINNVKTTAFGISLAVSMKFNAPPKR